MDIRLGFGSIPKPQYVFVSREHDYCWYMLGEDERRIAIYEKALTGTITGIQTNRRVENTFGHVFRTDLYILADKPYIVRSGSDTYFSKGLLRSLDALTPEQLNLPLTIAVIPGDTRAVFCNIYDPVTYRSIGVNWNENQETDWQDLAQRISLKINGSQNSHQELTDISDNLNISENRDNFIAQTDTYLAQLNWSPEQGREYLQQRYGRRSRHHLSDIELLEFAHYLRLQLS